MFIQYGIKSKQEKEANEKAQREQETAGRVGRQKKTPEEIAAEMSNDTDEGNKLIYIEYLKYKQRHRRGQQAGLHPISNK